VRIAYPSGLVYAPNMIQICLTGKASDTCNPTNELRNSHARYKTAFVGLFMFAINSLF